MRVGGQWGGIPAPPGSPLTTLIIFPFVTWSHNTSLAGFRGSTGALSRRSITHPTMAPLSQAHSGTGQRSCSFQQVFEGRRGRKQQLGGTGWAAVRWAGEAGQG